MIAKFVGVVAPWLQALSRVLPSLTGYTFLFVGGYLINPAYGFLIVGAALWVDSIIGALLDAGVFTSRSNGGQSNGP